MQVPAILLLAVCMLAACANPAPRLVARTWTMVECGDVQLATTGDPEAAARLCRRLVWFDGVLAYLTRQTNPGQRSLLVVILGNQQDYRYYSPVDDSSGVHLGDASRSLVIVDASRRWDLTRVVLHEYGHYFLANLPGPYPRWYQEGLAEYAARYEVDGDTLVFGRPDSLELNLLRGNGSMDLARMLDADATGRGYGDWGEEGLFHGTAWALYHYLRSAQAAGARDSYRALLRAGRPSSEALAEATGSELGELSQRLAAYLREDPLPTEQAPLARFRVRRPEVSVRKLGRGEVSQLLEFMEKARSETEGKARRRPRGP